MRFIFTVVNLALMSVVTLADTTVSIPAEWSSDIAAFIGPLIITAFAWLLRKLPSQLVSVLLTMRVDQLLSRAVDYGIATVKAASKDKKLSFNVGNEVVAQALQYVIDNGPSALIKWMGGPDLIRQKIIARLNIADDVALK